MLTVSDNHIVLGGGGGGSTGKLVQNSTLTIADNGALQANASGAGPIFRISSTLPIDGQVLKKVGGLVLWANP